MKKSTSAALALICTLAACAVKTEKAADTSAAINGTSDTTVTTQPGTPSTTTPAPTTPPSTQPSTPSGGSTTPSAPSGGSTTPNMTVTANGVGPIRAGMTVTQAASAIGGGFAAPQGYDGGCGYATLTKAPAGLAVMLENGKVARVEVRSGSTATAAGAKIGDSEARIKSLYAGRVASTPHKYVSGGHYLTVTPPGGGNNRIIFETDGKVVTEYRAGAQPAVAYVERCG